MHQYHCNRGSRSRSVPNSPWRCTLQKRGTHTTLQRTRAEPEDLKSVSQLSWDVNDFVQPFLPPLDVQKVTAPADAPPIVVLPGFGNSSTDYVAPFGNPDDSLATALSTRGFDVSVVPVERKDWFQVARGIFTRGFWSRSLTTHPSYSWYLARTRTTVAAVLERTGASQVILVCHSAGGWLGRAFLGDPQWFVGDADTASVMGSVSDEPNPSVRMVVTLGSPQQPPPPDSGSTDMTGGALTWVHHSFPGAAFLEQGVGYVCVCGSTVTGRKRDKSKREPRTPASYAHDAYMQVHGQGDGVVGDGIVPECSAFLEDAENVRIQGVFHSMSQMGTFSEPSAYAWYGSEDVVDIWLEKVVQGLKPVVGHSTSTSITAELDTPRQLELK